jgi:hypothetical protein
MCFDRMQNGAEILKEKLLTAACWYRAEGDMPGATAHSHRPSRCFARPYAVSSGYR